MSIVLEPNFTLESLGDFFKNKGIDSNVIEVAPAAPEWELARDAYLEIIFDEDKRIIIWKDNLNNFILRLRGIIFTPKEKTAIKPEVISKVTKNHGQQAEFFGSIDTINLSGITLEYKLPFQHGILDETIYSAYEEIKKSIKQYILIIELAIEDDKWDEEFKNKSE